MSDIKEDIKILEELKEDEILDCSGIYKRLSEREQQAIENILNRLEQDERVIEEMAESILWESCGSHTIEEVIDHFRKKCE